MKVSVHPDFLACLYPPVISHRSGSHLVWYEMWRRYITPNVIRHNLIPLARQVWEKEFT